MKLNLNGMKNTVTGADAQFQSRSDANAVTRLSLDAEIVCGYLESDHDIRIDGRFTGSLLTKGKVIIGEKGSVNGNVFCENVDIYGTMDGDLVVRDLASFMKTGKFKGCIKIGRLGVENGALFDGTCQILGQDEFPGLYEAFKEKAQKKA